MIFNLSRQPNQLDYCLLREIRCRKIAYPLRSTLIRHRRSLHCLRSNFIQEYVAYVIHYLLCLIVKKMGHPVQSILVPNSLVVHSKDSCCARITAVCSASFLLQSDFSQNTEVESINADPYEAYWNLLLWSPMICVSHLEHIPSIEQIPSSYSHSILCF